MLITFHDDSPAGVTMPSVRATRGMTVRSPYQLANASVHSAAGSFGERGTPAEVNLKAGSSVL